jgi:hypothetical protein
VSIAKELDVLRAPLTVDGERYQGVRRALGVRTTWGRAHAGALLEPVDDLGEVRSGDHHVVQERGERARCGDLAHDRAFRRAGISGSPRDSMRRFAQWKKAAPLITSTIASSSSPASLRVST